MEMPRSVARVGDMLTEHRRIALTAAIMIPLGALAARILQSRQGVQEQLERNQQAGSEANRFGEGWHILTEDDLS